MSRLGHGNKASCEHGAAHFLPRLFASASAPAGHLYTGGPRMCLGGIKGGARRLPAVRLTGRASGMRPPVARGQDQPARCRGEVPPPASPGIAKLRPGSLPEKGRSKGCHGCMGQLGHSGRPLATTSSRLSSTRST